MTNIKTAPGWVRNPYETALQIICCVCFTCPFRNWTKYLMARQTVAPPWGIRDSRREGHSLVCPLLPCSIKQYDNSRILKKHSERTDLPSQGGSLPLCCPDSRFGDSAWWFRSPQKCNRLFLVSLQSYPWRCSFNEACWMISFSLVNHQICPVLHGFKSLSHYPTRSLVEHQKQEMFCL